MKYPLTCLTDQGLVTYSSVKKSIISSANGLWHVRRQASIWTSADLLLVGPLSTHLIETVISIAAILSWPQDV